jgi:hypothetical protein
VALLVAIIADKEHGGSCVVSGDWFCVNAFGRNLASVAMKMFPHKIYFMKKSELCTFNMICKDIAAVNCVTNQYNEISFSSAVKSHELQ